MDLAERAAIGFAKLRRIAKLRGDLTSAQTLLQQACQAATLSWPGNLLAQQGEVAKGITKDEMVSIVP